MHIHLYGLLKSIATPYIYTLFLASYIAVYLYLKSMHECMVAQVTIGLICVTLGIASCVQSYIHILT